MQATKVFPNAAIGQGYGTTETCTSVSSLQPDRKLGTIGSAGELLPGIVAKVVKPDLTLAKEGEPGELVVTGPGMALYYYGNPTAYVIGLGYDFLFLTRIFIALQKHLKMDGFGQAMKPLSRTMKFTLLID